MDELLARILDAHGGMERCNTYQKIEATVPGGRRSLFTQGFGTELAV